MSTENLILVFVDEKYSGSWPTDMANQGVPGLRRGATRPTLSLKIP